MLNRLGFYYSVNTKGICLRFSKLIEAAQVLNQFQCEHPVCNSLKEIAVMEYCFWSISNGSRNVDRILWHEVSGQLSYPLPDRNPSKWKRAGFVREKHCVS